ncbi:ferredoxin [Microbacterium sp. zg.Y909]|uniref:ferredoxin n=1 Tax=Microbacterium sp. zg.Y909 TaxID=2969413 RepID=UPI00214C8487|nr:ferredoxin [Microbacterium sp. zg.Y909]MCR2824076.1 ferredoxin [Microbacterium sp. zg.Y909]
MSGNEKYTIEVDKDICVGGGQCVFVAPDIFTQRDEDGVVELLTVHPSEDQVPLVEEAVEVCPARVIRLAVRED